MPTAAELVLQQKYAELRAKKQKAAETKAGNVAAKKPAPGHVKLKAISKHTDPAQPEKQQVQPLAKQQASSDKKPKGLKVTLRSRHTGYDQKPAAKLASTAQPRPSTAPASQTEKAPLDPQAAALEAAKKALAARQAAKEQQPGTESRPLKRPTFKRPTAKRPAAALDPLPEGPLAQRPRTAAPYSSSSPREPVNAGLPSPIAPSLHHSPVWSPSGDKPYSPGVAGAPWSPSTAYEPSGPTPYSPTHQAPTVLAPGQDQGYTHTQAQQPHLSQHHHQTNEAERTVFVGNVPDHISDAELAEYFCEVGEVLTVQIRGNDGAHYAFVEFAYPEHVDEVLNLASQQPFMLDDNALRVQPRHYGRDHQKAGVSQQGSDEWGEEEPELPSHRAARIQAEVHAAAAAAVDELDPEALRNAALAPPPDRELMVYDDI